jgi:hypothetical protein
MSRRRQRSVGLVVLLAAGLALTLFVSSRPAKAGTTTYAQLQTSNGTVDIWQDNSTGVLTFQYDGAPDSLRFDPSSFTVTGIDGTSVVSVDTYPSSSVAWSNVDSQFGVSQSQVTSAIASGTSSTAPAAALANASTQNVTSSPYQTAVHYATNLTNLATGTGLGIPSLTYLDGYALVDTAKNEAYGPDLADSESVGSYKGSGDTGKVANLWYGSDGTGGDLISVSIAAYSSTNPTADGSIYQSLYNSSSYPHYYAPPGSTFCPTTPASTSTAECGVTIQYAQTDDFDVIFQYGSEWVGVTTTTAPSSSEWDTIIQGIVTH